MNVSGDPVRPLKIQAFTDHVHHFPVEGGTIIETQTFAAAISIAMKSNHFITSIELWYK